MEMDEKVAKAIYEQRNGFGCKPWSIQPKAHKVPYMSDAHAAINAIRETAPEMLGAKNGR